MVAANKCRSLAYLHANITLSGCTSAAMSVKEANQEQVVAHLVLRFDSETQAATALPILREGLLGSRIQAQEIALRQEGSLLRVRAIGNAEGILASLRDVT